MTRHRTLLAVWLMLAALALTAPVIVGAQQAATPHPDLVLFVELASPDRAVARSAEKQLAATWRDGYTAIVIDLVRLIRPASSRGSGDLFEADSPTSSAPESRLDDEDGGLGSVGQGPGASEPADPGAPIRRRLIRFLEKRTGQRFGQDLDAWRYWMWSLPYDPHPDYALFKGGLYGNIDPRMRAFFPLGVPVAIRLDKIDWGGVRVNGVPPLDHPASIGAERADYLKAKNVVFGVVVNGEARAYPERILAWHELVLDRLGGVELAVVFCTLCGTVIPYESTVGDEHYTFGTSGFLYKSNKLLFDEETNSLWSSVYGKPVVGALVGSGLELTRHPVVTTSWEEWRTAHPDTTVLSPDTGYEKDYREGAAYRDYFRHDRLLFAVDERDGRLKNKDEVLVLPPEPGGADAPLAIAVEHLSRQRILQTEHGGRRLLVLTSPDGANRIYRIGDEQFVEWIDAQSVRDALGGVWRVGEDALVAQGTPATRRPRLPAHRAFWFAWYAHHPDTDLIR